MAKQLMSGPRRDLTPQQRQEGAGRAAELVAAGMSLTKASEAVGAEMGVSDRAVRNWVKDTGVHLSHREQPPAFRNFNQARRTEVGNRLVGLLEGNLTRMEKQLQAGTAIAARELKDLVITFGILTDKRRLEDGQVTDRTEQANVPAREIIEAKILDLADRRKKPSPPDPLDTPGD